MYRALPCTVPGGIHIRHLPPFRRTGRVRHFINRIIPGPLVVDFPLKRVILS